MSLYKSKTMVDADRLLQIAWDNPLWDEKDYAMLFHMINMALKDEEEKKDD